MIKNGYAFASQLDFYIVWDIVAICTIDELQIRKSALTSRIYMSPVFIMRFMHVMADLLIEPSNSTLQQRNMPFSKLFRMRKTLTHLLALNCELQANLYLDPRGRGA